MDGETVRSHAERVRRTGFTIVENAIELSLVDRLSETLARLERERDVRPAMNGFEGHRTVRIYNLLAFGAPFTEVPVHESVLPIV